MDFPWLEAFEVCRDLHGLVINDYEEKGAIGRLLRKCQALKTLEGHTAWVEGLAFYAQGTRLVSVGADQTIRLWDFTEPKK